MNKQVSSALLGCDAISRCCEQKILQVHVLSLVFSFERRFRLFLSIEGENH